MISSVLKNNYTSPAAAYFLLLKNKDQLDIITTRIEEQSAQIEKKKKGHRRRKTLGDPEEVKDKKPDKKEEELVKAASRIKIKAPIDTIHEHLASDLKPRISNTRNALVTRVKGHRRHKSLGSDIQNQINTTTKHTAEPRQKRYPTNPKTTFTTTADELMHIVQRVLLNPEIDNVLTWEKRSGFVFECVGDEELLFEIEVAALPNLGVIGIRFHRISGNVWSYSQICNDILTLVNEYADQENYTEKTTN